MLFRVVSVVLCCLSITTKAAQISAENFSLNDIQNNQKITLTDYNGKVIYLDFWASWCSSCAKTLPIFKQWQDELGDDFAVISVNVDENKADGLLMAQKLQLDYPIAYDQNLKVAKIYGASVLPYSFIIDKKGDIRYRHVGFKDSDILKIKNKIKALLEK